MTGGCEMTLQRLVSLSCIVLGNSWEDLLACLRGWQAPPPDDDDERVENDVDFCLSGARETSEEGRLVTAWR